MSCTSGPAISSSFSRVPSPGTCFAFAIDGKHQLACLFAGAPEEAWSQAADYSARLHIKYLDRSYKRVLGLTPSIYEELWVAGKAMYKLLNDHPGTAHIKSDYWNAYSRITSVVGFDDAYVARLFIDSDAETSVLHWNGQMGQIPHARKWFRAFPFRLVEEPKVLVIGPGGGTDVVMAIEAGSPKALIKGRSGPFYELWTAAQKEASKP